MSASVSYVTKPLSMRKYHLDVSSESLSLSLSLSHVHIDTHKGTHTLPLSLSAHTEQGSLSTHRPLGVVS